MKYNWTREDFGYALRCPKGGPRAIISPGERNGWYVQILERDLPSCGPITGIKRATKWARDYLLREELLPADAEIGDVPYINYDKDHMRAFQKGLNQGAKL